MPVPVAPTITKLLWGTTALGALIGTTEKFTILVEWTNAFDADYWDVDFDGGTGSGMGISTSVDDNGGAIVTWWGTFDGELGAGANISINGHNVSGDGTATVVNLTPTTISGATTISATLKGNVFHPLTLGPSLPTDWEWTLAGAPEGITISEKTDTDHGGTILGSPLAEGIYNLTAGLTNYGASSNILFAQNYLVTMHVSGERYIQDFHSDTSRTAVNIRHPLGTVASWNTNTAGEVELQLGETRSFHAILRNGTGYLSSGVTNLKLVAKLPGQQDSPPVLSVLDASPTVGTFGAVSAWPLSIEVEGARLRALFDAANAPTVAAPDAAGTLLNAQISYTYGGSTYRSRIFSIRIVQPLAI